MKPRNAHLILILLVLLGVLPGCAGLRFPGVHSEAVRAQVATSASATQLLEQAEKVHDRGDWSSALELLQAGREKYPDEPLIEARIQAYREAWEQQSLMLRNQLLLLEVRRLVESLPLLEKLAEGQSGDQLLRTRILILRAFLDSKVPDLNECARATEPVNPWLARRCMRMAYRIAPSREIELRIAELNRRIDSIDRSAKRRLAARAQRLRTGRVEELLAAAEEQRQQGELIEAKAKIDEVLRQDPHNLEAHTQQVDLQQRLQQQAEVLARLGDRLYRAQQTGAAVAVWEAALRLDPQQQLHDRIDRARKVLDKLEKIRTGASPQPGG